MPAVQRRLRAPEQGRTYWLATVRPDGRPHVMPLLGLWLADAFSFITGESTRKGNDLARNPRWRELFADPRFPLPASAIPSGAVDAPPTRQSPDKTVVTEMTS